MISKVSARRPSAAAQRTAPVPARAARASRARAGPAKRPGWRLAPSSRNSSSRRCGVSQVSVMRSMSITGSAKPACDQHVAPVVHVGEVVRRRRPAQRAVDGAQFAQRVRAQAGEHQEAVDGQRPVPCGEQRLRVGRHVQGHVGPQHLRGPVGDGAVVQGGRRTSAATTAGPAASSAACARCAAALVRRSTRRGDSAAPPAHGPPGHRAPAPSRPRPAAPGGSTAAGPPSGVATSSCSQGERAGATRSQCRAAAGSMVGGRSLAIGGPNEYIDPMLARTLIEGLAAGPCPASAPCAVPGRPSRCARPAWPASPSRGRAAGAARCRCRRRRGRMRPLPARAAAARRLPRRGLLRLSLVGPDRAVQVPRPGRLGTQLRHADAQRALGRARAGATPIWCCRCRCRPSGWPSAASTRRCCWRAAWRRTRPRSDLLLRVRHTAAQTALDRKDRLGNVKGAFAVDPLPDCRSCAAPHVVLVDDVMTSGASLFTAARPCGRPALRTSRRWCWPARTRPTETFARPCSTSSWSSRRFRPTPAT